MYVCMYVCMHSLTGKRKKFKQHFRVNAIQPILTYIHNVHSDKKFTSIFLSNYLTSHHMPQV